MNSILKEELLNIKGSVNYWLGIGWIFAIVIAIVAIAVVVIRKNKKQTNIKNELSDQTRNSSRGKGFLK